MELKNYIDDGANWQAQAVLAYLRYCVDNLTYDINKDYKYKSLIGVTRYDNCREQGYIFFVKFNGKETKQRNYAVYQHRNSDELCIVINNTYTFNDPLSPEIWNAMRDKYDIAMSFSCGEILRCGEWIEEDMKEFLVSCVQGEFAEKNTITLKDLRLVPTWSEGNIASYEIRKDGFTEGYLAVERYEALKDDPDKLYDACNDVINLPF